MELEVVRRGKGEVFPALGKEFKNSIELIIFVLVMTLKLIYFNIQVGVIYESTLQIAYITIISLGVSLFLSCWTLLFSKRLRVFWLIVLDLVLSFIIFSDLNFFRYYGNFISTDVLAHAAQLGSVKQSIASLINIKDIVFILDIIVVSLGMLSAVALTKFKFMQEPETMKIRINRLLAAFLLAAMLIGTRTAKLNASDKSSWFFENYYFVSNMNLLSFHVYDFYNAAVNKYENSKPLTQPEKEDIKAWFEKHNGENAVPNKLTDTAKGKNLIVIQVEALQQFVINKKVNGREITPNLNKLIKRSMYFDNYYYETGQGNTSDAEFASNTSLLPIPEGAVYFKYPFNKYDSIGNRLKQEGYATAAFHGYKSGFWNRGVMYPGLGFDKFHSIETLNFDEKVAFGLGDKSFLNQSFDIIKNMQQPYYTFLVTLSSHYPYDHFRNDKRFNAGQFEGTFVGDYVKSVNYADAALGEFIGKLEKEGILDNSVLAIYGDHFAIDSGHSDELGSFLGKDVSGELNWAKLQKVPLIIHLPKDENAGIIHASGGQVDLLPTLANVLGLSKDNMLGNDLLSNTKNIVVLRNQSFTDGTIYFSAFNNTIFNLKTGKQERTDKYTDLIKQAQKKIYVSDMVIYKNLIPFLKEK